MKIRATINLDNTNNLDEEGSLEHGVYGVDKGGVYHMYYYSRTDLVIFEDVEVIEE